LETFCSGGPAVIVPLDTLGDSFEKRFLLGVAKHFGLAVIDRPAAAATAAFEKVFVETIYVQSGLQDFAAFTNGTEHNGVLSLCGLKYPKQHLIQMLHVHDADCNNKTVKNRLVIVGSVLLTKHSFDLLRN
jgi:hypothetical protein